MPEVRLRVRIFKDATFEVIKLPQARDVNKIARLRNSMQFLISNGEQLLDHPDYWPYIEAALRHIYPALGTTDMRELRVLIQEEIDILDKLIARKKISSEEQVQIVTFCQEMWYELELLERGLQPHQSSPHQDPEE